MVPKINIPGTTKNSKSLYSELSEGSENYIMKELTKMKERLFRAEEDNTELRRKVDGLYKN